MPTIDTETQTDIEIDENNYFNEAENYINSFQTTSTNNSSIIDIIAVYIKGQRILYTEAKTICEQRLTALMIPSILFTVVCSISNLLLKDYIYGSYITSCLNGLIAFILALINYLKLDARAEAHRSSAYKFDKLLSYVQFQSGKLLFLTEESKNFGEIIKKIEKDVSEIKETNQFVLPEIIRYSFPQLSGVNIFSIVKNILVKEIQYINDLANVMQKIKETREKIESMTQPEDIVAIESIIQNYEHSKLELTNHILNMQQEYITIDVMFEKEMDNYREYQSWSIGFLGLFKV